MTHNPYHEFHIEEYELDEAVMDTTKDVHYIYEAHISHVCDGRFWKRGVPMISFLKHTLRPIRGWVRDPEWPSASLLQVYSIITDVKKTDEELRKSFEEFIRSESGEAK